MSLITPLSSEKQLLTSFPSKPSVQEGRVTLMEKPPVIIWDYFSSSSPSRVSRMERILEKALKAPRIKEVYDKACAQPTEWTGPGPWLIELVDTESGGVTFYYKRKIKIDASFSDDTILGILVFELLNAAFNQSHAAFDEKARRKEIDCESYVKERERLEYNAALLHHDIMSETVKEMGWKDEHNELDHYKFLPRDFEVYHVWLKENQPRHQEQLRKQWNNIMKTSAQLDKYGLS